MPQSEIILPDQIGGEITVIFKTETSQKQFITFLKYLPNTFIVDGKEIN